MDPNVALEAALECIKAGDFSEASAHFKSLHEWIMRGGALPKVWEKAQYGRYMPIEPLGE